MFIKQFRLKTLSGCFMRGLQTLLLAVSTRANGAATTAAPAATTAAPAPCSEQDTWGCDEAECAAMGANWRCFGHYGCGCSPCSEHGVWGCDEAVCPAMGGYWRSEDDYWYCEGAAETTAAASDCSCGCHGEGWELFDGSAYSDNSCQEDNPGAGFGFNAVCCNGENVGGSMEPCCGAATTAAPYDTYAEYEEYGRCPGERPAGRLSAVGS